MQFAEHSKFMGAIVPGAKYEIEKAFALTKPKAFKLKIQADKNDPAQKYKIVKSKLPDCGTYKEFEAFRKTQISGVDYKFNVDKSPKKTFLDDIIKRKQKIPAPSHYKNVESSHLRLSSSPVSIRMKRH